MNVLGSGRVAQFLASYRTAFERLDGDAIIEHFIYPCHITSDGDEVQLIAIATRDEWQIQIERLVSVYRNIGVRSAEIIEAQISEISSRVLLTAVHWALRDASGNAIYDFHAHYTLVADGAELRIAAIAHNEMPRIQQAMARQ